MTPFNLMYINVILSTTKINPDALLNVGVREASPTGEVGVTIANY
jgi:hypothetical protein